MTDAHQAEVPSVALGSHRMFVGPTVEHEVDPKACVFCGEPLVGRRSREHVFPQWLLRRYDQEAAPFEMTALDVEDEIQGRRELPMNRVVAGRVCRDCNNGWMSVLEEEAADLLTAVASAQRSPRDLTPSERELLARWATKTVVAAHSADMAPRVLGLPHASPLVGGAMPAVHVVARQTDARVGFGWLSTQRWIVSYPDDTRAEVAELVGRSYKAVLFIDRLLIAVCVWPEPNWPIIVSRRSHVPLWPAEGAWLTYGHATDRHGVEPTPETEMVDMAAGIRVSHPETQGEFVPVAVKRF